jgi:histidine triad (HIT) family protein
MQLAAYRNGLEVPHAHLHLVPINTADDLNFTREKIKPTQEELLDAQGKILNQLQILSN